jgi:hypothetical protein
VRTAFYLFKDLHKFLSDSAIVRRMRELQVRRGQDQRAAAAGQDGREV